MKLRLIPKSSFNKNEEENLKKIVIFAECLLKKNNIPLPKQIYFYNSLQKFIKKVLPEIKNYGFNKNISKEIIKCALNNGTYGTINFKEDSIIEMNFNPFNKGEYLPSEFLELIVHESLHLHLSKKIKRDLNNLKFKFDKGSCIGNIEIIKFDEGYAQFMTEKILKDINQSKIKKLKISSKNNKKPYYQKKIKSIDIEKFDKIFEKVLVNNREKGFRLFKKRFNFKDNNKEILFFALNGLEKII